MTQYVDHENNDNEGHSNNDDNDGGITESLALVDEDEEVQGGACTCRTIGSSSTSGYFPGLLLALALAWRGRQNVVQTSPHAK